MQSLIPIGTLVLAKWPSTSHYYKARIIDYTDNNHYVCQFLDETVIALPPKYVDLPDKFQCLEEKPANRNNQNVFLDRSQTFISMLTSLGWIIVFLYVQHYSYYYLDLRRLPRPSLYTLFQQYPFVTVQYFVLWLILQLSFARYFPHLGIEQLTYVKESCPSKYYKHRSNSLLACLATYSIMYIFRDRIPLRELTQSYYLLALFSLGIALTLSLIILTNKLYARYCSITTDKYDKNGVLTEFDFHLFVSIRPGIILWPTLNFLLLLVILKYDQQMSIRFALSILLQTIYFINVFVNETSMIRQSLDISPPSSFDAIFANLCWVPFIASLTSFYIAKSRLPVHILCLILAIIIFMFGFMVQRLSTHQRIAFQAMNNINTVESVMVNDTQRILTSGCWRWCRHPHLLAEICMVIGWSLPAGINHIIPWLYTFYTIGIAMYKAYYFDRALRSTCREGAYEHYIAHVKYTLIPFVY